MWYYVLVDNPNLTVIEKDPDETSAAYKARVSLRRSEARAEFEALLSARFGRQSMVGVEQIERWWPGTGVSTRR